MDPISSAIGAILPFLNYLRPSKSPYLLISLVVAIILVSYEQNYGAELFNIMARLPVYFILIFIVFMSFRFVPEEIVHLREERDEEKIKEIESEIESQYKFSRSIIISCSLIAIYLIFSRKNFNNLMSLLFYTSILINLLIFIGYMFLRNIKEESPAKYAIFQISFMMSTFIIASALIVGNIGFQDGSIIYAFNSLEIPTGRNSLLMQTADLGLPVEGAAQALSGQIDWNFFDFLLLWISWMFYMVFWMIRLRKIVQFTVID